MCGFKQSRVRTRAKKGRIGGGRAGGGCGGTGSEGGDIEIEGLQVMQL